MNEKPLPPEYLVQHIQSALGDDPRARELGVDAQVVGDIVVLTGTVATPDLRAAIAEVVREVVAREATPAHRVVNELAVMSRDEGGPVEELPSERSERGPSGPLPSSKSGNQQ